MDKLAGSPDWDTLTINRPRGTEDLPVTLLHPAFGQFLDDCDAIVPTHLDYDFALRLSDHMRGFPWDDDVRIRKFNDLVSSYLGARFKLVRETLPSTAYASDGHAIVDGRLLVLAAAESKAGAKRADPFVKASYFYVQWSRLGERSARSESFRPAVLVHRLLR